jgi:beta-phosphoglucomutase-like phosphatase (HAD superfamily)
VGECVVIEDAPGGVEAAKRAGMRCIGVTTSRRREALAAADLVVDSLEEAAVYAFLGI